MAPTLGQLPPGWEGGRSPHLPDDRQALKERTWQAPEKDGPLQWAQSGKLLGGGGDQSTPLEDEGIHGREGLCYIALSTVGPGAGSAGGW